VVHELGWGLAITGVLALVNLALGLFLIHVGRTNNALVLVANGQHVLTDMWTSVGVLVGVGVVWVTGLVWLDPVVAMLAALNILKAASELLRDAYHGLMERADPEDTARIVQELQRAIDAGRIRSFHQLRHRRVNDQVWIELHLLFPGDASITQAHDAASRVEADLRALFPLDQVAVISHLEPADAEHEAVHPGGHGDLPDPLL
jgi:cation diffusion facilitator family transporter